jgi:hypothetical protein
MNNLLWLVNHPLWGNVAGIPTSLNLDTPEGFESRLSIEIHRILAELQHSTELELELLRGLLTSREILWPSEPHCSLSTLQEWTWEHYRGLNLTFFTSSTERSRRVFIGGLSLCLSQNWVLGAPHVRPASHLTWPGGQALWQHRLSHIGYPSCWVKLTRVEDEFQKDAKP